MLVYGLGLAAIAKAFDIPIDEGKCRKANEVLRRLNVKPWSLPKLDSVLNKLEDEIEIEAVKYYYSEECVSALAFAQDKKKEYFKRLPMIKEFLDKAKKTAAQRGWVKTWTGRRKRYPKSADAYKAPNAIIQGGCGDILKDKVGKIDKLLHGKKSGIVNMVHDEIQIEFHREELDLLPKIMKIMEDLSFDVPITVDVSWADENWGDKKSPEEYPKLEELINSYRNVS